MSSTSDVYNLHNIIIGVGVDVMVRDRLRAVFGPFMCAGRPVDVLLRLRTVQSLPPWQPAGQVVSESRLLTCTLDGDLLTAHFPRWGTVSVDLAAGTVDGDLLPEMFDHYGAFDDMLIIVLGPLLRRRGFFSLHAFAAARDGKAVLLVGDIGAGKTTTGLSLLEAGWKLVSNDSPLLSQSADGVLACAYPGLLAAYDDTLARFPSLHRFQGDPADRRKRAIPAQDAYGDVWQDEAKAGVLLFPRVTPGLECSRVEPMEAPEALLALVPNSIERWDRDYIAPHLALLQALVQQAPAYRLLLAPDIAALPDLIGSLVAN
ncbi:MAG: hypothetical protein KDI12_05390 [Anaerolineae bacterium]|nr:hypothetical protein [Anaerolineae bacterium]MCO5245005.1 hypothetical protein [Anaerolineae bacterium]HRX03380.1 hypothetical protein [Anaerolineae bacterium]